MSTSVSLMSLLRSLVLDLELLWLMSAIWINTKDLTTTIGHETSHALDNQDPSINTNPQNNASKTDNEIYADNYGDALGLLVRLLTI
jgi:hypothetical protein